MLFNLANEIKPDTAKDLMNKGVKNMDDLKNMSPSELNKKLGKSGLKEISYRVRNRRSWRNYSWN